MRVLVCCDGLGRLTSAETGAALGRAFARRGAQVAVVPMATGDTPLRDALDALGAVGTYVGTGAPAAVVGVDGASTSVEVGRALAHALEGRPERVVLDLTGLATHDAGAGLLAALGASADVPLDAGAEGLVGLGSVDLGPARAAVGETELIGVIPRAERDDLLLGLRGLTARRGHPVVADPALMLRVDEALDRFAAALGVPDAPGVGAAGGAALAVLALGGRLTTGVELCAEAAGLARSAHLADVIVTGADSVDFGSRGGDVVMFASDIAEEALKPCVAIGRTVEISGRELRTLGIEAAYPLGVPTTASAEQITDAAASVAASWTWSASPTLAGNTDEDTRR